MRRTCIIFTVLGLIVCSILTACNLGGPDKKDDTTLPALVHTTPAQTTEETTPEVTTPEETTPTVTEPDFSNNPDPDGTKRY